MAAKEIQIFLFKSLGLNICKATEDTGKTPAAAAVTEDDFKMSGTQAG